MNRWIKAVGFLFLLILVCSVLGRVLTAGETLSEYAEQNPEVAYATPDRTVAPSPLADAASTAFPETEVVTTPAPSAMSSAMPSAMPTATPAPLTADETEESVRYQEGFFYQPLTDAVVARITGISYPVSETIAPALSLDAVNAIPDGEEPAVSYDDLRYMQVLYYDFNGEVQTGELICHKGIAQDLAEIFYELYLNEYQLEKVRLIDEYGGDDTASMLDNNTSCFNYRVVDGTSNLSKHALGCAIDVNPFYNPYVVFNKDGSGETYISPEGSEIYADRSQNFPYKIDENDLCYKLFKEHGFTWGGNWNSSKDYQHFQKVVD